MARCVALWLALAAALLAVCGAQSSCPAVPLSYPDGAALTPQLLEPGAGAVVDIRWLGSDSGFVLALTSSGHLWRSVNGGLTWSDDTPRLAGAADNRGVAAIVVPERNPSRALLVGHFNRSLATTLMWTTTTSGYTYEQPCALASGGASCTSAPPDEVVLLKPHPVAPDVLALLSRRRTCNGQSSDCLRQDVWVTTDFAHTWQSSLQRAAAGGPASAVAGFIDFDWAPETQPLPAGGGPPSAALLATAYLSADDQLHGVYWAGYWDKRGAQQQAAATPRRGGRSPARRAQCTWS